MTEHVTSLNLCNPFDDDKLHEECGVFGIYGHSEAAALAALGLHALQHRGQEAAGIVSHDGRHFHSHKAMGKVGDNFSSEDVIKSLKGDAAVGHNRYATTGGTVLRNVQPIFADLANGGLAVAHNGNLTNASTLRRQLVAEGSIFQSTMDTEVIIHLVANSKKIKVVDRIVDAMHKITGAYSLVALTSKKLVGMRDPFGVRPLVLGKLDGAYILTSESCALDIIGAEFIRDVEPGEVIVIDETGISSTSPYTNPQKRFCIFEHIYFARPDSVVENRSVYDVRKGIGRQLAIENPVEADAVIPVPDSGTPAAIGYAEQSGLPFELGIIRNHYVGRTFIEPTDQIRHLGVKLKHNANQALIKGKRVVLVDDSIVRGTTSTKIVQMVRDAGAAEVHMRIASPPTTHSCFYGVDTPSRQKLLAAQYDIDEMCKFIGADSLSFISLDGLYVAMGEKGRNAATPQYCDACFTGEYPIDLVDHDSGADNELTLLSES
ncbi:amidophosphoribosyltransferase [Sneathiella chinensis]|uniref:Amidophosphoribosyltransferase n=1 Tax=Sneathiella chinensis TaxID=349750 RepID=A0ABQ5U606_9PROT|nr:amidophosphoribosyltransferase [Sneathiella chinensis]GLQ07590.1 amidophosphoribosyltransferase [Sneathiella chinensis]